MNERERRVHFSRWFEEQFQRRGVSEREFARLSGVAVTTPRQWRSGANLPDIKRCAGIAEALRIPVEAVMQEAGYLDMLSGNDGMAAEPDSPDFIELRALWSALPEPGRQSLLATGRALRDTLTHPENGGAQHRGPGDRQAPKGRTSRRSA